MSFRAAFGTGPPMTMSSINNSSSSNNDSDFPALSSPFPSSNSNSNNQNFSYSQVGSGGSGTNQSNGGPGGREFGGVNTSEFPNLSNGSSLPPPSQPRVVSGQNPAYIPEQRTFPSQPTTAAVIERLSSPSVLPSPAVNNATRLTAISHPNNPISSASSPASSHATAPPSVLTPLPLPSTATTKTSLPYHQLFHSPADRFGLAGLIQIIKSENNFLALGSDLTSLGLDLATSDNLYSSFITPWSDSKTVQALNIEPEYHLSSSYNVQPPPAQSKIGNFSDETLFFIFYSQPKDLMQEMAAHELYKHNWRYHKELRLWLTKEAGTEPTQKTATFERGSYIFFDPTEWQRIRKDFVLVFEALERKL